MQKLNLRESFGVQKWSFFEDVKFQQKILCVKNPGFYWGDHTYFGTEVNFIFPLFFCFIVRYDYDFHAWDASGVFNFFYPLLLMVKSCF